MSISVKPGWHVTEDGKSNRVVCFQELQAELDTLPFLKQWEVARFFKPQGPLDPGCMDSDLIQTLDETPAQDIHSTLEAYVRTFEELAEVELPTPTPASFWRALEAAGGEEAADAAGILVYRMKLEIINNKNPLLSLASPVLGTSRRLFRKFEARRLLRVTLDEASEKNLQRSTDKNADKAAFKHFIRRPLRHLGYYYRGFYHQKGALYFWAVDHCYLNATSNPPFPPFPVSDFLETIIPRRDGRNDSMSLAKYSARMSLWLSKTEPIVRVDDVRWLPDLTSHTLPIGRKLMETIAQNHLGLHYIPSCLAGTYRGVDYVWTLQDQYGDNLIGIYQEDQETWEANRGKPHEFVFRAFKGHAREEFEVELVIRKRHLDEYEFPDEPEQIMTDGNALMSYGLALAVCKARNLEAIPAAVQARIGGSKGLWALQLNPDPKDQRVWIEIRDSQHKYNEAPDCDWTFEFVNCSGPAKPASIGPQLLGVLARSQSDENNFLLMQYCTELLDENVKTACASVLDIADRPLMRKALEKMDRICKARDAEQKKEGAHINFKHYEEEDEDLRGLNKPNRSGCHPISGQPDSWAAEGCELVGAGFDLEDTSLLSLITKMLKYEIETNVGSPRIAVPKSRVLYVMSDPTGLLKEGEVFIQLSEGSLVDESSMLRGSSILTGPVLITRSPCVQPTDIQKVKAVDRPELRRYYDVCICSVDGSQSLLSLLSGGDYDGDTCNIIFDETITSLWKNTDRMPFIDTSRSEAEYWENMPYIVRKTQMDNVGEMNIMLADLDAGDKATRTGRRLLGPLDREDLRDACLCEVMLAPLYIKSHFGSLSNTHKELLSDLGPMHWKTILVGQLYCQALDAAKAGKVFKPHVLNRRLAQEAEDEGEGQQPAEEEGSEDAEGNSEADDNDEGYEEEDYDELDTDGDGDMDDQDTRWSPTKRAATEFGDLSIDEDDNIYVDDPEDGDGNNEGTNVRRERLHSVEAELGRTRAGTVYREGGQNRARHDENAEGMNKPLENGGRIRNDHGEEEVRNRQLLLDDAQIHARSKALIAKLVKDNRTLSDEDITAVWRTLHKAPRPDKTRVYLNAMYNHVKSQARKYKTWKSAYRPPYSDSTATGFKAQEQVRRKTRYAQQRLKEQEDLILSFWSFPRDAAALHPDLYHQVMASCAYSVSVEAADTRLNEFPFFVAFRYILNIKADAVERRSAEAALPALRVVGEVLDTLHSRLKLPKVVVEEKTGAEKITEIMAANETEEGSPTKKRKSSEAQKQQNDIEIEDFLEDYAWPGIGSEEGGDLSTDDELDKLMQSVGINDSGIGGSQGVYA